MELIKNMMIHIASWKEDNAITIFNDALEGIDELSATISYPIKNHYNFKISLSEYPTVNEIIDGIVNAYKIVYSNPDTFKIWGHCIEDLVIESIELDKKNKRIDLYIGS